MAVAHRAARGRAGERGVCSKSSLGICCFCRERIKDAPLMVSTGSCCAVHPATGGKVLAVLGFSLLSSPPSLTSVYPAVCGVDCCASWLL